MKVAIVSGGDSNYYPLLCELIRSIQKHHQSKNFDICIMDAGLEDKQINDLLAMGVSKVKAADWPVQIPSHKIKNKTFLKACVARPFIRELFSGYDVYVWLDGDSWVQTWEGIELLVKGAIKSGLAICPQTDRAYGKAMRLKWLGPVPYRPRSFYYSNARKAFSGKMARALFPYPTLNAGVFALSANAPHWGKWQALIVQALRKGKVFTAEQLTLGIIVYIEKYSAEFLPAWCNWLLENKPCWDNNAGQFVEPFLPHHPISIMHLSGCDEMRMDKKVTNEICTINGNTIRKTYRGE